MCLFQATSISVLVVETESQTKIPLSCRAYHVSYFVTMTNIAQVLAEFIEFRCLEVYSH